MINRSLPTFLKVLLAIQCLPVSAFAQTLGPPTNLRFAGAPNPTAGSMPLSWDDSAFANVTNSR